MKNPYIFLSIVFIVVFSSCDSYQQDEYRELIVVEGYLVSGQPLSPMRLSTTLPVNREYNFNDAALSGAIIQVSLLDENNEPEETFEYKESAEENGVYIPVNEIYRAEALRTYRLDISFNNRGQELHATTTIPDRIEIQNEIPESVVYQGEQQLELELAETRKTREQNVFVFNTISLEASLDNLTPFYRSVVEEDDDIEFSEYIQNSSGLINEGNFDINPDGTILLKFPWIGVAFYGENLVVTLSVDKNMSDLVKSQNVQLGGSTLSPGEIPNLQYNIEGGIGVFGSLSSDTVKTRFTRPF